MKVKCKKDECQYEWEYKGQSPFYATCPRCRNNVRINKEGDNSKNNKT